MCLAMDMLGYIQIRMELHFFCQRTCKSKAFVVIQITTTNLLIYIFIYIYFYLFIFVL